MIKGATVISMDTDIRDIRRNNLRLLIKESGLAQGKFAEKIDTNPSYVSQVLSKKIPRELGHDLSRRIEILCGKPKGWMDAVHEQFHVPEPDPYSKCNDFLILMCNLCDDLIDEGLFPADRDSRRALYGIADDLTEQYQDITLEKLEVLLRNMTKTPRRALCAL